MEQTPRRLVAVPVPAGIAQLRLVAAEARATLDIAMREYDLANARLLEALGARPADQPERILLTMKEVGQMLGVSRSTVQRLVASGTLPTITTHKRPRVHRDTLLAYMSSSRVGA